MYIYIHFTHSISHAKESRHTYDTVFWFDTVFDTVSSLVTHIRYSTHLMSGHTHEYCCVMGAVAWPSPQLSRMSQVSHKQVMPYLKESYHTYTSYKLFHIWRSPVTHKRVMPHPKEYNTHKGVMPHLGVLSHTNESCHIWKSDVTQLTESRCTFEKSHVTHIRVMSHTYLHIPVTQMSLVPPRKVHPLWKRHVPWKRHVTRFITSWFTHTYESTKAKDDPIVPPKVLPIFGWNKWDWLGVTFSNAVSKLKAQARTSLLPRFSKKRRWSFELWALKERQCHPSWDWLHLPCEQVMSHIP